MSRAAGASGVADVGPEDVGPEDVGPQDVVVLDGTSELGRELLGGKAWGVNRMASLGLPVPPAFALTTRVCRHHLAGGERLAPAVWEAVRAGVSGLEARTGRRFGAGPRPLLVSVRSGAAHSMPGMMDTVLDLGMDDAVEAALAVEAGDAAWAADTRRRFREQYRAVVGGGRGDVPDDAEEQLRAAVCAVLDSWDSARAVAYRAHHGLRQDAGTAVTVQAMVFGNLDDRSGTGVLFTRDCRTGDPEPWGEWLPRAQGEDVVSGTRDPLPLADLARRLPEVHAELLASGARLEADARDVQDVEFTVQSGRLHLLQTRTARRAPRAAVRCAVALVDEGVVTRDEAVARVSPEQARLLLQPDRVDPPPGAEPLARGLGACPGVATGVVVDDASTAEERAAAGEDVVLARPTTSPEDLRGLLAARAVVTETGGVTSHAAVVGRELGRPTVVGCGAGTLRVLFGRQVTVDGGSGCVWAGAPPTSRAGTALDADLRRLARWASPGRPDVALDELPSLLAQVSARGEPAGGGSAPPGTPTDGAADVDETALLRLVALKGRAGAETFAESLGAPVPQVRRALDSLCRRGLCATTPTGAVRTAPEGRAHLARLLAEERAGCDPVRAQHVYDRFCTVNDEVKAVVTAWQVREDGAPNDHADPGYDALVLGRLAQVHADAAPVLEEVASLAPRLARYPLRLRGALARVQGGEHSFVARLVVDSFHTVWFELHEDLMSVAGRTRAAEAEAGRAS